MSYSFGSCRLFGGIKQGGRGQPRREHTDAEPEFISRAGLRLEVTSYRVRIGSELIGLTPIELRVLKHLMQHPDRVHAKAELLDVCHGGYTDATPKALTMVISRLRRKLGHRSDLIETVHGIGYRFGVRRIRTGAAMLALCALLQSFFDAVVCRPRATLACASMVTLSTMTVVWTGTRSSMVWPGPTQANGIATLGVAVVRDLSYEEAGGDDHHSSRPISLPGDVGSSIAYTGSDHRYITVADPGTALVRGNTTYLKTYEIRLDPERPGEIDIAARSANRLRDRRNVVYRIPHWRRPEDFNASSFNGEPARVGRGGAIYVGDQYSPRIGRFDASGKLLDVIEIGDDLGLPRERHDLDHASTHLVQHRLVTSSDRAVDESSGHHGGVEAIAMTPSHRRLLVTSGMHDRATYGPAGNPCVRLVEMRHDGTDRCVYSYPLEHSDHRLVELLAVSENRFLAHERLDAEGSGRVFSRLYLFDLRTGTRAIPGRGGRVSVPESRPVEKEVFIDFADGGLLPIEHVRAHRIEGLTFGPRLKDGRYLLLGISDNEQSYDAPTVLYAFAIDPMSLPGLEAYYPPL
ncbi:esterase-like activity of phytase family protein [Mucisphaera calidilacus]|uniref:Phosphate regulon transcriptional regulatory protein PhoB n=1 Tax=Mucisphaera calidilacus TaxID=2527982 RepID=A0A518BU29_9BACT|nr:esterase-like activity of phytase family protein [Mucisphaera calidilacus]QDU70480.1 Phosphate regulon transcriptional regulatory protein PhoB [Mucisphaera calidilacus]